MAKKKYREEKQRGPQLACVVLDGSPEHRAHVLEMFALNEYIIEDNGDHVLGFQCKIVKVEVEDEPQKPDAALAAE